MGCRGGGGARTKTGEAGVVTEGTSHSWEIG